MLFFLNYCNPAMSRHLIQHLNPFVCYKQYIHINTFSVNLFISLFISSQEKDIQMRTPFQDVGDFEVIFTECSDILCYLLL